ncbi:hypothetical protein NDU88_001278 [Pleurodeles waltl]|uniref:Uncharacterized protein n=1 Tax=Pleurodeles waltl TaxID=8319 RepID=A0AAV7THV5_PLEWA|nr:hypothetical protein NDU88_001278 [Pleurodeles waltl]
MHAGTCHDAVKQDINQALCCLPYVQKSPMPLLAHKYDFSQSKLHFSGWFITNHVKPGTKSCISTHQGVKLWNF